MKLHLKTLATAALLVMAAANAHGQSHTGSFGFNATSISGAPSGEAVLTGGGTYDLASGFLKTGGGFRCLADINQGPLAGCKAGDGVRWEGVELLPSTTFKCTGDPGEALKTAVTDGNTLVMLADFYLKGSGSTKAFSAKIIVSAEDEASDIPGIQNVWIQGVGCADALANFR